MWAPIHGMAALLALKPVGAWDHARRPKKKLVPGGLLEVVSGRSFFTFTGSHKTSDFPVDGLLAWWHDRQAALPQITRLVLNLDTGPECSSRRTRFLQRAVQFADETGLELQLVYYPPYHSKYNAIERYWGGTNVHGMAPCSTASAPSSIQPPRSPGKRHHSHRAALRERV